MWSSKSTLRLFFGIMCHCFKHCSITTVAYGILTVVNYFYMMDGHWSCGCVLQVRLIHLLLRVAGLYLLNGGFMQIHKHCFIVLAIVHLNNLKAYGKL